MGKNKFHHIFPPEKIFGKITSGAPWKKSFRRPWLHRCDMFHIAWNVWFIWLKNSAESWMLPRLVKVVYFLLYFNNTLPFSSRNVICFAFKVVFHIIYSRITSKSLLELKTDFLSLKKCRQTREQDCSRLCSIIVTIWQQLAVCEWTFCVELLGHKLNVIYRASNRKVIFYLPPNCSCTIFKPVACHLWFAFAVLRTFDLKQGNHKTC